MTTAEFNPTPIAAQFADGETVDGGGGKLVAADFGDAVREARFLRESAGLCDFGARTLLKLSGADVVSFLHRMLTQDIQKQPANSARRAALLERKGHLVADMVVTRAGDEIWLDVAAGRGELVAAELEKYVIVDDVSIARMDGTHTMIGIFGPQIPAVAAALSWPALAESAVIVEPGENLAWAAERKFGGLPGFVAVVNLAALENWWRKFTDATAAVGGGPAGFSAVEQVRIFEGVPRFGADLADDVLPKEGGIEDAISYAKGCYVGQETTYRLHFRGQPARRLMRLEWPVTDENAGIAAGASLFADGKDAGTLTSVASVAFDGRFVGLGFVKRAFAEPGTVLAVGAPDGPVIAVSARAGISKEP